VRNDLFGERESSELAAVIDGTLGTYTNRLLIQRASGWDLKTPEEADGPVAGVLQLIRDRLTDKRKKDHDIAELRAVLLGPPYGLPVPVMPIFTAAAIRKEHGKLKWVNKTGAFSSLLWDAFNAPDGYRLRFDTFKPKQLKVLDDVFHALRLPEPESQDDVDERARSTVKALRDYYAGLPDAVKTSSKLPEAARKLFALLKRPGQDAQSVADLLLKLVQAAESPERQLEMMRDLFGSVDRVADERGAMVREVIEPFSRNSEKWARIDQALKSEGSEALAVAIRRVQQGMRDGLDRVAQFLLGKLFDALSDVEIGELRSELRAMLEAAARPNETEETEETRGIGGIGGIGRIEGIGGVREAAEPAEILRSKLKNLFTQYRSELTSEEIKAIVSDVIEALREGTAYERGGE
jgi:hypothetical protein